jgi:hypothetical protein
VIKSRVGVCVLRSAKVGTVEVDRMWSLSTASGVGDYVSSALRNNPAIRYSALIRHAFVGPKRRVA